MKYLSKCKEKKLSQKTKDNTFPITAKRMEGKTATVRRERGQEDKIGHTIDSGIGLSITIDKLRVFINKTLSILSVYQ